MLFNNEAVLKVPRFFHTCENPRSIKALLTKFNHGDLSHVVLNWSKYALNVNESLFEVVVCNQKLMELHMILVIKGTCPNSL